MMNRNKLSVTFWIVAVCIGLQIGRTAPAEAPLDATVPAEAISQPSANETCGTTARLSKPVIGIATLTKDTYVRAIRDCGGIPVVLPIADGSPELVDEYLELLDGLLMPGGNDIHPSEWGEELHPKANLIDDQRHQFEKALVTAWIQRTDKPLLGICLGCQWINVAHGGSIIQDIPSEFGGHPKYVSHMVGLEPDSRLSRIFGETEFEVNSFHHQAVREVGEGLRAVAKSPDGIIEAIETTNPDRYLIGVQWHPEKLISGSAVQQRLFQAFIDASLEARD